MARKNLPGYLLHKRSGQAVVVLNGKTIYLGKYKSKASREEYESVIADFIANGKKLPPTSGTEEITIQELAVRYMDHAKIYYVQDGKQTMSVELTKYALDPLVKHYGKHLVSEFGPKSLKFVREKWVKADLARSTINSWVNIIRQAFEWGVENEIAPEEVFRKLKTVKNLKEGRSEAKDTKDVVAVPDEMIEKILPFLPPIIADMVQVQRYGVFRPQDVTNLRSCDIDRTDKVWKYTPYTHKMKHKGKERNLPIGPRAQKILEPYLIEKAETPEAFLFSPSDSIKLLRADQREKRKSKVQPSQLSRKKANPKRKPGTYMT